MTILKGIPRCIPPQLLYALASMGHGDSIVLGDANFPSESIARRGSRNHENAEIIRCDGMSMTEILDAICTLMPVDTRPGSAAVMQLTMESSDVGGGGVSLSPPVWEEYKMILKKHENGRDIHLEEVERFHFYDLAKSACCVVATGESSINGNLILVKGVLDPPMKQINV